MPQPRFRARTFSRIRTKLPSGKTVIHYRKPKVERPKCKCGATLKGIPRKTNLPASKKRVERPYSNLCSSCSRKLVKASVR